MKKGMTVTLDNDLSFNLVDSVTYSGEKFFAAVADDDSDDNLYFFKVVKNGEEESLQLIDQDDNQKVIEALIQHMDNTF